MASSEPHHSVPFTEANDLARRLTEASSDLTEHILEQGLTRDDLPEVEALITSMLGLLASMRSANERDADEVPRPPPT